MPFYISKQSVIDRYGEEFVLFNADRNADQDLDQDPVARAIKDAEAEVNSYVAKCYTLPLPGIIEIADPPGPLESNPFVPPELRRVAVDIAVYRLATEYGRLTKEIRRRYDDAVKWLKSLASKDVSLTVGSVPSSGGVTREGPDRIFTRETQKGLL